MFFHFFILNMCLTEWFKWVLASFFLSIGYSACASVCGASILGHELERVCIDAVLGALLTTLIVTEFVALVTRSLHSVYITVCITSFFNQAIGASMTQGYTAAAEITNQMKDPLVGNAAILTLSLILCGIGWLAYFRRTEKPLELEKTPDKEYCSAV